MENVFNDIRYAIAGLRKHPGFTIIVVMVLALGIGANSAIFSVVNGVLLTPLPYRDSDRLVMIWGNFQKLGIQRLTAKTAEYEDYRAQDQVFVQVSAFANESFNIAGPDQAERISGVRISANLFSLLGSQVAQGREINSDENQPGGDKVVVVSHGLWQRQFGAKRDAVGQTLRLNDQDYTVIGVMPAGFEFPHAGFPFAEPADVWVPLVYSSAQLAQRPGPYHLNVIARLKPGVSLAQARAHMNALGQRFESQYSGYRGPRSEDGGWRITLATLQEEVVGSSGRALLLLSIAVALVLIIACANVANLLLVRATARQKEIAIRLALGATRWRILRQLLIESLLLALLGGTLGVLLAAWGVDTLAGLRSTVLPRVQEVNVDWRVLVFTALLTILTALIFGMVPSWQASKFDLQRTLKENRPAAIGRWRREYLRNLLLVGEVALSLILVVGAGLLVKSFIHLQQIKPAMATDSLLTAEINLPATRYTQPAQVSGFFRELVQRVESLPGVQSATYGTSRPLSGVARNDPFVIEGRTVDPNNVGFAGWQVAGARYFQTLGIPLLQGRDLTLQDGDEAAPPVAVINQTMAQRYWPAENPIGRRVTVGLPGPTNPWMTIIGVAKDLPRRLDAKPQADLYLSRRLAPERSQILLVRTAGSPSDLATPVRRAVAVIDRSQPLTNVQTMSGLVADTVAPRKFSMSVLGLFAGMSLALATLGIYGVMAHSVSQRTHEIGIRMALGATRRDVLRMVLKQGMALAFLGVGLGIALSLALTRLLTSLLFEVKPNDFLTFATATSILLGAGLLASYLPARRAIRVNPLTSLKCD